MNSRPGREGPSPGGGSRGCVPKTSVFVVAQDIARGRRAPPEWKFAPYVNAFAEAGMVGACADWFAVTALFRRPFGLPIPHTAIVPRHKDRIAEALGGFVARHFLAEETILA